MSGSEDSCLRVEKQTQVLPTEKESFATNLSQEAGPFTAPGLEDFYREGKCIEIEIENFNWKLKLKTTDKVLFHSR